MPAGAHAAPFDRFGFHLQSAALYVHENAGKAVITVQRTDTRRDAQVGFIAVGPGHPCGSTMCTAQYGWDFTFVQGRLDFPVGVASETFDVPIVDHHADTLQQTVQVSLYGPWPIGFASPSAAVLTILNDDPFNPVGTIVSLAGGNPLATILTDLPPNAVGTVVPPAGGNPPAGDGFFVDGESDPAQAARQYPALNVIAREPWTARFGSFSGPDVGMAVTHYLARAAVREPGAVPMLATYRLVDGHCGRWADPPTDQASYHNFIERFAQGIGSYRAVLFLEMDSLITVGCLSPQGVAVRMHELHDAIDILTAQCPRLVIYLDAGAADAVPARETASLLRRAGVANIQGFFTNSTHFDWTSTEIRYGEAISRMTGGKHFVINTSANGQGPLKTPDAVHQGNEVLCNPPGRGLGPKPTMHTGFPNVDAFAWILHPGESTGLCGVGAPSTGVYWPAYALGLVRNADFRVR
jgi:endoglucanase